MLALVGTLAFQQDAMTQTTTDTNAASPAAPAATDNAAPAASNDTATATAPAASDATAATATNAPAAEAAPAAAPATSAVTAAPADTNATSAAAAPAAAPADTNAAPAVSAIPLIEFQDVPLTVAIENLARQAGINYLLDPKIGFGQPDASGVMMNVYVKHYAFANYSGIPVGLKDKFNYEPLLPKFAHFFFHT